MGFLGGAGVGVEVGGVGEVGGVEVETLDATEVLVRVGFEREKELVIGGGSRLPVG